MRCNLFRDMHRAMHHTTVGPSRHDLSKLGSGGLFLNNPLQMICCRLELRKRVVMMVSQQGLLEDQFCTLLLERVWTAVVSWSSGGSIILERDTHFEPIKFCSPRYFGGIKLGTGGLARAYGNAARECLRAAPKMIRRLKVDLILENMPLKSLAALYGQMDRLQAERVGEEYLPDGMTLNVMLRVESENEQHLAQVVSDLTAGAVFPKQFKSLT
jgi:hypothetical protein